MALTKVRASRAYVIFFSIIIFLFPIKLGSVRLLNEPIFIAAAFASIAYILFRMRSMGRIEIRAILFGLFFSVLFTLILYYKLPDIFTFKDLVESLKPLVYALIFVVGFSISGSFSERSLVKYVLWFSSLSILFSALVYLPFLHPLVDLYKGRTSDDSLFHFYRFSGTLGYPGGFGYWVVFSSLIALYAYYKQYFFSFRSFALVYGVLLLGLLLSGSRGAIIIGLLSTTFFLMLSFKKVKSSIFMALLLIFSLIFICVFSSGELQEYVSALSHIQSALNDPLGGTFAHRVSELERLVESFREGHLLGHGPDNVDISRQYGPVESAYYYYGYKFGLVGLFFYFLIVLVSLSMMLTGLLQRRLISLPFIFGLWSVMNLVVAGVSNSITEEYKSFYMYFLLLGMIYFYYFRDKEHISHLRSQLSNRE